MGLTGRHTARSGDRHRVKGQAKGGAGRLDRMTERPGIGKGRGTGAGYSD